MIEYVTTLDGITPEQLEGFFEGWPDPPSSRTLHSILEGSARFVLALEGGEDSPTIVGFVTAVTDGVLAASIPLLEVKPAWRAQGIGSELVRRILADLGEIYMVDLVCDEGVRPFYESLNFKPARAMVLRRYASQSGVRRERE